MKKVQSIYQVMQLRVPLKTYVHIGPTSFVFSDAPQNLAKVTGRPVRITDEGVFLAPEAGIVSLHPGVYLVIETSCSDNSDTAERLARESNEECAAVVSLLFGKRACEIHIHIGDNVIDDGKMSFISEAMRDPRFQKHRDITPESFQKTVSALPGHPPTNPPQTELALRWYMKGRREPMGPDAYLSCWIALEVLLGEWKNLERKISEHLAVHIPGHFAPALIRDRLKIGRLLGLRVDIVHKGKHVFSTPEESFQLVIVREILEELLKLELGIDGRERFTKILSDPTEWDRASRA